MRRTFLSVFGVFFGLYCLIQIATTAQGMPKAFVPAMLPIASAGEEVEVWERGGQANIITARKFWLGRHIGGWTRVK